MSNPERDYTEDARDLQAVINEHMAPSEPRVVVLGANGKFDACQLCGAKDQDLRPYGPNGEYICYDCGMKDPETTEAQCRKVLFGVE